MILRGQHYRTGEWIDIGIDSGQITSIEAANDNNPPAIKTEIIAPAYFDLQINGCLGVNFTSANLTAEDIQRAVGTCEQRGVASFCPTVITAARETIKAAFKALAAACGSNSKLAAAMPCFHLEGPYISAADGARGAHPRAHVRPPNWDEFQAFQDAAGGRVKLVTLAPEVNGAIPFIEKVVKAGVVIAVGHSSGPPSAIRDAIKAGAALSTHLGNGCQQLMHRHENILWEQLSADELSASFIPDGHHLPWALVHCILRCKSPSRCIITCDASPLAGFPPGRYSLWEQQVQILPEGKIVLPNENILAGACDFTSACVEKLMKHIGLTYSEAHAMAADHPRRLLGLPVPSLEMGQPANLVLLRRNKVGELHHTHSVIAGQLLDVPAISELNAAGEH
jgi:N-acetylglucosamine-6-phosphate deacetylase